MGGSVFFSRQRCASFGKIKNFIKIVFFHKTWLQKGSLLTKKNFFIRQYLWNVKFAIHTLVYLYPSQQEVFFSSHRCAFYGKIENFIKIIFFHKNRGSKRLPPDKENHLRLENFFHQGVSMETWAFAIHTLLKL